MAIIKRPNSSTVGPVTADVLGFNAVTGILEREVGPEIFYLDPDISVLTILADSADNDLTDNPNYEWFEKSLRPKTTTLDAASTVDGGAGGTTLVIADADVIQVGDLVDVNGRGEILLVTARDSSTSFDVIRGAAGTTASASIVAGDGLTVVGSAFAEGTASPEPDEWQEVRKYGYTQIFKRSFAGSGTREATMTYFGRGFRSKLAREKMTEFKLDVERAFLFGGRSEVRADGSATPGVGTGVLRTTGSIVNTYTPANVLDLAGGALTEPALEGFLESVFQHTASGDTRTLMASTPLITILNQLAVDKMRTVSDPKLTYGIAVKEWVTGHGRLLIVKHRGLGDAGTVLGRGGIVVDAKKLAQRTLAGRDVKLQKDVHDRGDDGWKDQYFCEIGFQAANAEVHGLIKSAALAA
jgi:hypothetical protein